MQTPPGGHTSCSRDCDDDAIAMKVASIGDDVAQVHTDTQVHPTVVGPTVVLDGELILNGHRAFDGLGYAVEGDQH